MKLKKWSVKQLIFEREMNNQDHGIHFNGFKLPKDKDFLLAVLEELYRQYGDSKRDKNLKDLEYFLEHGVRRVEINLCHRTNFYEYVFERNVISLSARSKYYYPYENEFHFENGGYMYGIERKYPARKYLISGYHIHKYCLVNPLTGR